MAKKQPIPAFCRGSVANLTAAVAEGGRFHDLDRVLWCYINEGEHVGELAFVMPADDGGDPIITYIAGDNLASVVFLDTLPLPRDAINGIIYVVDNKGYRFDGIAFVKLFDQAEFDTLRETVTEDSENIHNALDALQQSLTTLSESVSGYDERLHAIEETMEDYSAELDQIKSSFDSIQNTLSAHSVAITSIQNDVSTLNGQVNLIDTRLETAETSLSNLSNGMTSMNERVTSTETAIEGIQSDISDIQSDIGDVQDSLEMDFIF